MTRNRKGIILTFLDKFKSLGIDVNNHVSVVRTINGLAISDTQKTTMLRQYLNEIKQPLSPDARTAAGFPT